MAKHKKRVYKVRTLEEHRKMRDTYIRRTYGRSLRWYEKQLKKQHGHCACCSFVPKEQGTGLPLHIEHDHKMAKLKVYVEQEGKKFIAFTNEFSVYFESRSKVKAKRKMTMWLRKKSVRGLVCWPCNSLIRKSYDQPDRLVNAGKMLDKHQKKMKWRKYEA